MTGPAFTPALGRPEWTGLYDLAIALLTREKTWRRALVGQLDPGFHESILDVGCGTGTLAVLIALAAPESRVTGLDPDATILERARAKATRQGASIAFIEGFAHDADRAGGPFDKVTSSLVFHQVPMEGKRAGFAAIWRALRPGGSLHVADYGLQRTPLMRSLFRQVQRLDGFENTEPNARGVLPELMKEAGFLDVEERQVIPTLTGSISLYRARKPL
jgi:ubiquinone/menaquinone biosynthesis C-methylase UbiE